MEILFLFPMDMCLARGFLSLALLFCGREIATLKVGDGHTFLFPEVCVSWFGWPRLAARNHRCSALAPPFLPHCSHRRLRPKTSILHAAPSSPAMLDGTRNPFIVWPSTLPGQLGSMGMNHVLNLASLLAGQLCSHVCSLLSHVSTPLFKRVPM